MVSRQDAVLEIARRYDYDAAHAHQVECLAGTLFMETEKLHRLGREDRKLLEYAAILHDIGYYLTSRSHHKHALQLIMMEPLIPFTRSEKLIIANLTRYHRKSQPSSDHAPFAILTKMEQRRVELMAPILRIADALDKSHSSKVVELACHVAPEHILIEISADQDATAEIQAVEARGDMFRLVYSRSITVTQTQSSIKVEE